MKNRCSNCNVVMADCDRKTCDNCSAPESEVIKNLASLLNRSQCFCPVDRQNQIRTQLDSIGYDWRAEIFGAVIRELSTEELMRAIEQTQIPEDMESGDTVVRASFVCSTVDGQDFKNISFHIVGTEERTCATGVHLTGLTDKELGYRLGRAVEDCFCKGFDSIYIHVGVA